MSAFVRSCCTKVALTTAIAMTAVVIYPAVQVLEHQEDKAVHSAANVPMLAFAGFQSGLSAVDSVPTPQALAVPWVGSDTTQTVAPAAAEATPGDLLYDFVRGIAIAAAVAVLPLWWIGFPITFPIGALITREVIFPGDIWFDPLGIFAFFFVASTIATPVALVGKFLPPRELSAASPAASVARSSVASTASLRDIAPASADDAANQVKGDSDRIRPAAQRSNRPAKSAASVVSTEVLNSRDEAPSISKGNAASSRDAAGRSGAKDEAPQRP